jgi:hypothetical protein
MSASLKQANADKGGRDWLKAVAETSLLLSSIVRIMHPKLFEMGLEAIEKLQDMEDLQEVLKLWTSIFNGVQIISNRETPIHRDFQTRPEWYDLLVTVGPYKNTLFELPGVGIRFVYNSGTIMGLSGKVLRHGVTEAVGERICVAYYMRENIHRRLGTCFAGWNTWDSYKSM